MIVTLDWFNIALMFLTVALAVICALSVWSYASGVRERRRDKARHHLDLPQPPRQAPVDFDDHATAAIKVARHRHGRGRDLLATPPAIDGVSLRDYLTHHSTRACPHVDANGRVLHAGTWPCVVEDLYAAALDSRLAMYFDDVDLTVLKRHFLSALVTLTHVGLTVETADRLEHAHAELHITGADFDLVVEVLVNSIAHYTTPEVIRHVLPQLTPAVTELRGRLVTA